MNKKVKYIGGGGIPNLHKNLRLCLEEDLNYPTTMLAMEFMPSIKI